MMEKRKINRIFFLPLLKREVARSLKSIELLRRARS